MNLPVEKPQRESYAKVLIVCEGEKTEPYYFYELKDHYKLNSANVEICGECGSDPLSIYRYAKRRYREEKEGGDPFDHVFCVFDKDTHANYQSALDAIARANPKNAFQAINSVPCFEYWLLLHYFYTTKPYNSQHGNSACHQVLTELRSYMPDYAKGSSHTFSALIGQLELAKHNAARSLRTATKHDIDNPTTRVHELVDFLQNIKKPR